MRSSSLCMVESVFPLRSPRQTSGLPTRVGLSGRPLEEFLSFDCNKWVSHQKRRRNQLLHIDSGLTFSTGATAFGRNLECPLNCCQERLKVIDSQAKCQSRSRKPRNGWPSL